VLIKFIKSLEEILSTFMSLPSDFSILQREWVALATKKSFIPTNEPLPV